MTQVLFAFMLGLEPSAISSTIVRFKHAQSLITHRPAGEPIFTAFSIVDCPSVISAPLQTQYKESTDPDSSINTAPTRSLVPVAQFSQKLELSPIQQAHLNRNYEASRK